MMVTKDLNEDELDPGIRNLVVYLHSLGFVTIDSGDGSKASWQEGALDFPHVHIKSSVISMVYDTWRLRQALNDGAVYGWEIDAVYKPDTGDVIVSCYKEN